MLQLYIATPKKNSGKKDPYMGLVPVGQEKAIIRKPITWEEYHSLRDLCDLFQIASTKNWLLWGVRQRKP